MVSESPATSGARSTPWVWIALLCTLLAFVPSLGNDFTSDDRHVAMGHDGSRTNEMVAVLQPIDVYFTSHYWRGTAERSRLYRPITILSFALRHWAVGDSAVAAHLINVLLHGVATLLVYLLLRGLRCAAPHAAIGAAFFGLHAIHSEVVAAVFGRAELLAFCGGAGATLLLTQSRGAPERRRWGLLWAAGAAMFVAVCSKESALLWIPFAACYSLARSWTGAATSEPPQPRGRIAWAEAAALLIPAAVFLYLRANMLAQLGPVIGWQADYTVHPIAGAPAATRILTATMVWGYGLLLTVLPFSLSADYGAAVFPIVAGITEPEAILSMMAALALAIIAAAAVWRPARRPHLFIAGAAFLGFGVITSNVLFPIGTMFAERLYYAPSLGLAALVAWIAGRIPRAHVPVGLLIAGVWLGASAIVLVDRNQVWQDNETLALHEAEHQPSSVRMRVYAAHYLTARGQSDVARHHLERAVQLDPGYVLAWQRLAELHEAHNRRDAALAAYRSALRGRPRELTAVEAGIRARVTALQTRGG